MCPICECRLPLDEEGRGLCNFCWELKSRIYADPELSLKILNQAFEDRAKRSSLPSELRDMVIGHIGTLQAEEYASLRDSSDLYDMLVDGVRGLDTLSDEALLGELAAVFDATKEDELIFGSLGFQLRQNPLWEKMRNGKLAE